MRKRERRAGFWRSAPLALARQPRLAVVVAIVAGVLAFVAATPFLFLSSVSSAAVSRQVDESCRGVGVDPAAQAPPFSAESSEEFFFNGFAAGNDLGTKASARFGPAIQTVAAPTRQFGLAGNADEASALLVHRTGHDTHLQPLVGGGGGVWVPDTLASELGISVGDTVRAGPNEALSPVSAIYADMLLTRELDDWSCPLASLLGLQTYFAAGARPPPAVFVSIEDFAQLATVSGEALNPDDPDGPTTTFEGIGFNFARVEWPFVDLPTTLTSAREALDAMATLDQAVAAAGDSLLVFEFPPPSQSSRMEFMTDRAEAIRTAVGGAVAPMALVCILVALGLAWGLGQFWVDKRRADVRLLFVRGVAPGLVGVRAALEMLVPGVIGVVTGWALATAAMRRLGPSEYFDPGIVTTGLGLSLLALVAGLLATLVAVWRRTARSMELYTTVTGRSRRFAVPLVWDVAALAGAWWSWRRLSTQGVLIAEGDLAPPVDILALLFPVLFLAGGLGLCGRVLRPVFRMLRQRGRRLPAAPYLAVRRLAAEHATALILVGVSALAVGVVTYGSGLVRSTETTADAKSKVEAGGDVWASVVPRSDGAQSPPLPGRSTIMSFDSRSTFGGEKIAIRVVDPATFTDGAFWDGSFDDEPIDDLLARLTETRDDGSIPVLAIGAVSSAGDIERVGNLRLEQPAFVVARVETFPTVKGNEPTLIMASGQIPEYEDILERRVLARDASVDELRAVLAELDWGVGVVVERSQLRDSAVFLPTIWTFGLVRALGVVVALLAVAALLVYVDTRERRRAVAAALLARMGVPPWRHWRALLAELGVLTALALVIGTALGWFAVRAVSEHLDPAPDLPPGPLLRYPSATTAVLVAAGITVVAIAASWAQRAALHTNLGEALREDV